MAEHMAVVVTDGGRSEAGYVGRTGDCVVRSVAIATEQPYGVVYEALSTGMRTQRSTTRGKAKASARDGVNTTRKWFKDYMRSLGWKWVPTMGIGTGCTVHLAVGELPMGRLVVAVSRHYTAVINGVIHDSHDPQRSTMWFGQDGKVNRISERCVYGYWMKS